MSKNRLFSLLRACLLAGVFLICILNVPALAHADPSPGCFDADPATLCDPATLPVCGAGVTGPCKGPSEVFTPPACGPGVPLPCTGPAETFPTPITPTPTETPTPAGSTCTDNNPQTICEDDAKKIYDRLRDAINFLSALVGVVVIMMIIIGGIQYTTAGSDPKKIAGAKARVYSAILALVVYIFIFAFLQWLVPGGVL